jgi:cellobiose phosphorylase
MANQLFETKYGYFTRDGREYVIKNWRTPRPWVNVISNGSYGLVVSQLGGGFSFIGHSNLNRLTRWNQDLVRDDWGRYLYIRDNETGEFWSPTVRPAMVEPDSYQCCHGVGYTRFESVKDGIECNLRLFVPVNGDLEIWTLKISNESGRAREISLFTYLEWCLGAAPDSHREFHKTFIETEYDGNLKAQLARKRLWEVPASRGHWNTAWDRTAYLALNCDTDHFEGDKAAFLGLYHDLNSPTAVVQGTLKNNSGKWNDSIGSLQKNLSLKSGEKVELHLFLGAEKESEDIQKILVNYRQPGAVERAFSDIEAHWDEILSSTKVQTPDEAMNLMTNVWLKYQAISGRLRARAAYYQQSGAFGFRDQLQDSQIYLYCNPEFTKQQLLLHAAHQYSDGRVLHWWHPITELGLDANMTDDLLWLPYVLIQYIKETGDWSVLDANAPYYDAADEDNLLNHSIRSIDRALRRFSERGLPLILAGDWNDGLSAVGLDGRGESVWLGMFLYAILTEIKPLLDFKKLNEKTSEYSKRAEDLRLGINKIGWDGQWYWRATKDSGEKMGSSENRDGKIYLNPQTWSVISGLADKERQTVVMDAVHDHLMKEVGPVLLTPAYSETDSEIGYLTRYAPGVRENGGIYTHAATWAVLAESLLGRGDKAFEIYRNICPPLNGTNPDHYAAEPYVTPGNIDGPDSPNCGQGGWTWYTGSAAWLFRVTLDGILGIRADYDGLIIDPAFPSGWKNVKVSRNFRGMLYCIHFQSSGKSGAVIKEINVDGKNLQGNRLPVFEGRKTIHVTVYLA